MATETIRPNAAGDETSIDKQYPDSGAHWDKVDDVTPDEAVTFISADSASFQRDLYGLNNPTQQSGIINSVTCYIRVQVGGVDYADARISIKTNDQVFDIDISPTTSWANYSHQWTTNPQSGNAWTWAEINALQAGVALRGTTGDKGAASAYCTQVYVIIDYTAGYDVSCSDGLTLTESLATVGVSHLSLSDGLKVTDGGLGNVAVSKNKPGRIILSKGHLNPKNDPTYRFGGIKQGIVYLGYLVSSWWDGGLIDINKSFQKLLIKTAQCDGSHTVSISYEVDDANSWELLGTVTSNGWHTKSFEANVTGKKIRLRLTLCAEDTTKSPIVEALALHSVLRPDSTKIFNFTVRCADALPTLEGRDTQTASTIKTNLWAARGKVGSITLYDEDGDSHSVIIPPQGLKETYIGKEELKGVERVYQIQALKVTI